MKTRCIKIVVGALLFVALRVVPVEAGPQLQVQVNGGNVLLAWPTNATGFRAQSRTNLASGENWIDVNATTFANEALQYLIVPSMNSPQFFRLFKEFGTNPTVNMLAVSTNAVAFGSTATFEFNIVEPDLDLAAIELTWTNVLGAFSNIMSANSIGLSFDSAHAVLPIRPEKLPLGISYFKLRLVDRDGLYSAPVFFEVNVVGAGGSGTAPQLLSVTPESPEWRRSSETTWKLKPGFVLDWSDLESDVERIRATLQFPSGQIFGRELSASKIGFTNASGLDTLRPFTLTSTNPLGNYIASFQFFDHTGRSSAVQTAQFQLNNSAPLPPSITGFYPASGPPGTQVYLFANNLNPAGTNYQITLAGIPCSLTNEFGTLIVTVPTGAVTAPFKIVSANQVSASAASFIVPPVITLTANREAAAPGEPVQFFTSTRSATNQTITFSVNEIVGGNPTVGWISSEGRYVLPLLPPTNVMTIVASLTTQPEITATSLVQVLPPTTLGGTGWVSAAQGGSVSTTDGSGSLDVPPGALVTNAFLNLAVLRGTNVPLPTAGRHLLGGLRLGPDGTMFNQPVTVTVPLLEARPPGTVLALKYFIRATSTFVDEALTATVAANGREAVGQISHFSEVAVDEPAPAPSGPPVIFTLKASELFNEGLTVPVLLTGQNLVPGVRVEVWRDGQPAGDVIASHVVAETNRLGVLIHIPTLRDLNFGDLRNYELRVSNSANQSASTNLLVRGLNELIVPPGVQTNLSGGLQTFSEVDVGVGSVVRGNLGWFVNGSVRMAGTIDAQGQMGAASLDEAPGTNAFFSDFTRRGANGGRPDESGVNSYLRLSDRGDFYYGEGGKPGEDTSSVLDFIAAILNLASCVFNENVIACGRFVGNIIEIVTDIDDINAGTSVGRPGMPGARANAQFLAENGYGGGGGGGGGDLNFVDAGEGGGAGGNGGRGVFILARGDLLLEGQVNTRGGDGGDGGLNVVTTIEFNGGIPLEDSPSSNRGGGGGGGSGGSINLLARGGFRLGSNGGTDARGGNPGNSLTVYRTINASTRNETARRMVRVIDAKYPPTPSGRIETSGALVPPRQLSDLVTDRGLVPLQLHPLESRFSRSVTVTIRGESTNQIRQVAFRTDDNGSRKANLLLFPGFNTLSTSDGHTPENPTLNYFVLYLAGPDSDGDGLSDADEAVIGSNPLVTDTDGDGINDWDEVLQGLDPTTGDSDGDLISDAEELSRGTDPRRRDSDGDGFWDGWEIRAGTSPTNSFPTIPLLPAGTLYAEVITSVNGRVLAIVDPVTGKMFAMGRVNGGAGFGIAFNDTATLFASQGDRLVRVSLDQPADATGQLVVTNIGNFSTNGVPIYCYNFASSFYAGKFIGIESRAAGDSIGQFLSIDPNTGLATRIGSVQPQPLLALAVLKSGSTQEMLFASATQTGAADTLQLFPNGPGAVPQSLGSLNWTNVYGLTPAAADRLFAARTDSVESQLVLINTTNSTLTLQATLDAPVFDLALSPCPVPCLNGPFPSPLSNPGQQFVTADFNGDTFPDLAVTQSRVISGEEFIGVAILHGRGDGTFTNVASYFFNNSRDLSAPDIALGDVNGDGRTDIIVMQPAVIVGFFQTLIRPAELMTLLANPAGGFQAPIIQAMPSGPSERLNVITAGDWSGDGKADLIFANESLGAYSLQGNGAGLFTNAVALLPGSSINGVLLADVNADGRVDFLGVGSELNVRLADLTGGFLTNQTFSGSGRFVTLGDVDGDGDLDAVATDYGAVPTVFYNNGAGAFPNKATFNPRNFPNGVYARAGLGDLSGDGRVDAAVPSNGTTITAFISGVAPGTLAHTMTEPTTAPFAVGGTAAGVLIFDANNDGLPDLVTLIGGSISVLLQEATF